MDGLSIILRVGASRRLGDSAALTSLRCLSRMFSPPTYYLPSSIITTQVHSSPSLSIPLPPAPFPSLPLPQPPEPTLPLPTLPRPVSSPCPAHSTF